LAKRRVFTTAALSASLLAGMALPVNVPAAKAIETVPNNAIIIAPTPQSLEKTGPGFPLNPKVGLVTETGTDPSAINELKNTLKKAGVKEIVESDINSPKLQEPVVIWLGEFSDDNEVQTIKEDTGIKNLSVSENEGYTLISKQGTESKKHIVISGKDDTGTYYGTQTFRQLIVERQGTDWIPEVEIHDWPTMPIRGAIEGFYGTPWSHEDRLRQLEFYGEHKMNSYIYAPKDDPYHREQWRDPYPQDKINQIAELVTKAKENHVDFTFAISPGVSVVYSSAADLKALMDKAQAVWDVGVRSFAIFLDDINPTLTNPQDMAMFGNDKNPSAAAQAYLLNQFNEKFIKTHPGAERLITVPTDYYQAGTTPYRARFADLVQPDIVVQWTGIGVVAPTIKTADADLIHGIFKHDLLIWDNYPVNDYDRNSLFLAPLVGREAGLTPDHGVIGLTANPMNEAEASKIPLYTVADYTWNPSAYNPDNSLENSLKEFAGSTNAYEPLKRFVDANYSTRLNDGKEPYSEKLKPLMDQFWAAYDNSNAQSAAVPLLQEFEQIKTTPAELEQTLDNPNFLQEVAPYLKKMELYGTAGQQAVNLALAKQAGDTEAVEQQKAQLQTTLNGLANIPQKLSLGAITNFFERALDGINLAEGKIASASTSEVDWLTPDLAVDGNPNTRWASLYTDNQWLSVDLGKEYSINKVVLNWEAAYGKQYKIQVSQDGTNWTDVYTELNSNGGTDEIEFPAVQARYVQMQGIKRATGWGYSLYELKVFNTNN
jgi:hyaluronoglucosaminidase